MKAFKSCFIILCLIDSQLWSKYKALINTKIKLTTLFPCKIKHAQIKIAMLLLFEDKINKNLFQYDRLFTFSGKLCRKIIKYNFDYRKREISRIEMGSCVMIFRSWFACLR